MRRTFPVAVAAAFAALLMLALVEIARAHHQPDRWKRCRQALELPVKPKAATWKRTTKCVRYLDRKARNDVRIAVRFVFPRPTWDAWYLTTKCETGGTYSNWAVGDGGNSVSGFQINRLYHRYDRATLQRSPIAAARKARSIAGFPYRPTSQWTCARIHGLAWR